LPFHFVGRDTLIFGKLVTVRDFVQPAHNLAYVMSACRRGLIYHFAGRHVSRKDFSLVAAAPIMLSTFMYSSRDSWLI